MILTMVSNSARAAADESFLKIIMWTDESTFKLNRMVNRHVLGFSKSSHNHELRIERAQCLCMLQVFEFNLIGEWCSAPLHDESSRNFGKNF